MKKLVRCTNMVVDCVENETLDYSSDESVFLGFNFTVKKKHTEKMKRFISETLKYFGVPLIHIYTYGDLDLEEENITTKEQILQAIKNDAEFLISESQKHDFVRK